MVTVPVRRTSLVVSAVLIPVVGGFVQMFWMLASAMSTDSCMAQRGPAICSDRVLFWGMRTPAFGVVAAWATWCVSLLVAFSLVGVGLA